MDFNALKTFVLAAEDLNFTTVAERRHTVQSAVSAQIRKLEALVGETLLQRGRGERMQLTPAGETFLVYARRLLALAEEAVETLHTANAHHVVRLGTTMTLALSVLTGALSTFAARHRHVQIQIQCDRSDALLARLEQGEIDVAFMMDQGRHLGRAFVHSQPLVWVCAPDFSVPGGGPLPLAFLTDGRDLRRYALKALDDAGRQAQISHLSPHPVGVRALVQSGLALTVMPYLAVSPPLVVAPDELTLPSLGSVALAGYRTQAAMTPETDDLMAVLEKASIWYG
ncbi:MAG: LysR family transcriptional regulator [Pseudomonadota bacterium]